MTKAAAHLETMHNMLARGDVGEAEAAAHAALTVDPDAIDAHALLGKIAAHRGDHAAALRHLDRAADHGAVDPDLAAAYGVALVRAGRYDDAIAPFRIASEGGSYPLDNLLRLGWVYERLERFDALRETLARARTIAAASDRDIAIREAILLSRTPEWGEALRTLDDAAEINGEDQLARGRLRDRAGRYREAWSDFVSGKREIARARHLSYPATAMTEHFAALTKFFTEDRMAQWPRAGCDSGQPQPIFVAGAPRSGTTLAERLIAEDPAVDPRGELPSLFEVVRRITVDLGSYPAGIDGIAGADRPALVAGWRDAYLALGSASAAASHAPRVVDKMPFNEQHLPLIALMFPNAPVIVMTRHPLDVIVSMMSHQMTHGYHCALDPVDAARHLAAVDELTAHWQAIGCVHDRLRYEDLVSDPDTGRARLSDIADLSPDRRRTDAATPSTPSYAQVREPVTSRSVFRWRHYADDLRDVMPIVEAMAARRGYSLD